MARGRPAPPAASPWLQRLLLLRLTLSAGGLRVDAREGAIQAPNGTVLPFRLAVRGLAQTGSKGDFCLSVPGPFMGRLSNTVAMMNVVLRTAVESGATFHFPRYYTEYMAKEGFGDIFGAGEETCDLHEVETYAPICPPGGVKAPASKGRCSTNEFLLDVAKHRTIKTNLLCNCKRAVIVNGMELFWDHDYSTTHGELRKRYWHARKPLVLPREGGSSGLEATHGKKPQLVVHVRLGDVENLDTCLKRFTIYNCRKRLEVEVYELVLSAIRTVLPASCVDINLVTDGKLDSPDIIALQQNLTGAGIAAPKVWTADMLSSAKTFELMTHADVLVFGSSGFGQLAAILARPNAARIGAPMPKGYNPWPLHYLPNTTQLVHPAEFLDNRSSEILDMAKARSLVSQNQALQALAASCRALHS